MKYSFAIINKPHDERQHFHSDVKVKNLDK